jgi:hypothetical protein
VRDDSINRVGNQVAGREAGMSAAATPRDGSMLARGMPDE